MKTKVDSSKLDPILYYISYGAFTSANGLFSIFVNILFFSSGSIAQVIQYQMANQTTILIGFLLSGYIIRYISARSMYSIGTVMMAAVILSLFIHGSIISNPIIFGLLFGLPSGIFWGGNATFNYHIARSVTRFSFLSINSSVSSTASLLTPPIAGLLISTSMATGISRYAFDFIIASAFLVVSSLVALLIKNSGESDVTMGIRGTRIHEKDYWDFKLFFFAQVIIRLVLSTLVPVYIFEVTGSYVIAGFYGTMSAAVGLASNSSAPILYKHIRKLQWYAMSAIIMASLVFLFTSRIGVIPVFVSSAVVLFFIAPLSNRGMTNFMYFLDRFKTSSHFWINREYYIYLGRVVSLGTLLGVSFTSGISTEILLIPGFSFSVLAFLKVLNRTNKESVTFIGKGSQAK